MEPKLIKGLQADYIPSIYPGDNPSGVRVYGKNLLVCVDQCSPKSAGGIDLPDDMIEKMTEAGTTGCIYGIGPEAFRLFDDGSRWSGDAPQVGDRIFFEKYAGALVMGMDGKVYRVMDYRAVAAGIDKTNAAAVAAQRRAEAAAQAA